jgi:hypothetical protein
MLRKAHALASWAFQAGHQVLCQVWSRAKIDLGRLIAIRRMGHSAQRWIFSMMNALRAMVPRSGLMGFVVSIFYLLLLLFDFVH